MKWLTKMVNAVLGLFWPPDENGNRPVWLSSQNLNEGPDGKPKGWAYRGRCHLYGSGCRTLFRFEWTLWASFCGFRLKSDVEERGMEIHIAFPPVAFWLTLPIPLQRWLDSSFWAPWNERFGGSPKGHLYNDFVVASVRVHDWALWWNFLKFDWGWSQKMPRWMDGNFDVVRFFLGALKSTEVQLQKLDVLIPMPEGAYPATVQFEERTWKRARLPWTSGRGTFARVDMKKGIPHAGKGENSWDCGPDALFGLSCKASTVEEAIAATVESALGARRRYDGDAMAVYPAPAVA